MNDLAKMILLYFGLEKLKWTWSEFEAGRIKRNNRKSVQLQQWCSYVGAVQPTPDQLSVPLTPHIIVA